MYELSTKQKIILSQLSKKENNYYINNPSKNSHVIFDLYSTFPLLRSIVNNNMYYVPNNIKHYNDVIKQVNNINDFILGPSLVEYVHVQQEHYLVISKLFIDDKMISQIKDFVSNYKPNHTIKVNKYIHNPIPEIKKPEIKKVNNNETSIVSFIENKQTNNLIVLFKNDNNIIPTLYEKDNINTKLLELDCNFMIVDNYVKTGRIYNDVKLTCEFKTMKQKYRNIYFITDSNSWVTGVSNINYCTKMLISNGGDCKGLEQIDIEMIKNNIMRKNNDITFMFSNHNYKHIIHTFNQTNKINIKNIVRNKFYAKSTESIFSQPKYINNMYTYFKVNFNI